jgi:hypothetical protein
MSDFTHEMVFNLISTKILFSRQSESKKIPTIKKIQFDAKKSIVSKHLWMLVKLVENILCTLLNFM